MYELRSPTVKRRRIAKELTHLREQAGLTRTAAAKALDMTPGNLSRIENREITARPVVVRAALALYGVTGEEAETLVELARGATERGWWQKFGRIIPDWFGFYVGLEEEATSIETYESEVVPGLFQTEDYARVLFRLTTHEPEIDQKVDARMQRQKILTRENPVHISAILNEAVLLRPVGSSSQFRSQLEHLIELTALPNISIRVLPFNAGGHPAMTGPFMLLRFPDAVDGPVVYLDNYTQGQVLEESSEVAAYHEAHMRLTNLSLSQEESRNRVREAVTRI